MKIVKYDIACSKAEYRLILLALWKYRDYQDLCGADPAIKRRNTMLGKKISSLLYATVGM